VPAVPSAADTRAAILEAALVQLAEPGADVGIESIAERAGVSRATISYHFHAAGDHGSLE
jgi:AcrR family transcriptional regulator